MKLALAQTRPITGDIDANVARHGQLVERAVAHGAEVVVFSELSLAGYEPTLAKALAVDVDDPRLTPLQQLSDLHQIRVAAGVPTRTQAKPRISLVLFEPGTSRGVYSKQYLHGNEEPYFVPGPRSPGILDTVPKIGLAICYELSVHEHAEATFKHGANIYLASVAETEQGTRGSHVRLPEIAKKFDAPVVMVNCVGTCDGVYCAGKSAVWNPAGEQLVQLDDSSEGLIIFDTDRQEAVAIEVSSPSCAAPP